MSKINIKKFTLTTILLLSFIYPLNTVMAEKVEVDNLIYKSGVIEDDPYKDQITNVNNLPDVTLDQGVGVAIKTVLRWSFYLTLISLVVAAIYYIMSMGKEEDITKARNIILYLVIGMAIISAAYGIITGVSRFNFFNEEMAEDSIQAAEANK